MEDWDYDELNETVKRVYDRLLNKSKGYKYAIARTFNEFETVCNEGETERLIVHLIIGEIILTHPKVYVGIVDVLRKELEYIDKNKLEKDLTLSERENLLVRIHNVQCNLDNVMLDHDPDVKNS